jgi:hypothetical protein
MIGVLLLVCIAISTNQRVLSFSSRHGYGSHQQRRLFGTTTIPSLTQQYSIPSHHHHQEEVRVFDNVFSEDVCRQLHELAVEHDSRNGDSGSIFDFQSTCMNGSGDDEGLVRKTPLEWALASFLAELEASMGRGAANGDADTNNHPTRTTTVEVWSRDEYKNLEAHCDIDERELENEGTIRCPDWAHVLYVQVHKQRVVGPTCVFTDQRGGWKGSSNEHDDDKNIDDTTTSTTSLVTVPAVQGRVLRFPGNVMHAVPKPVHRWLLSDWEERELVSADEKEDFEAWTDDEDEDDDEEEEEEEEIERSVILFNTWSDRPPQGVHRDYATEGLPEGIQIEESEEDDGDYEAYLASQKAERLKAWEEDYGHNAKDLHCNPREEWSEQSILRIPFLSATATDTTTVETDDNAKSTSSMARVPLMGVKQRRLHPKKNVRLQGPRGDIFLRAFEETTTVTCVPLLQDHPAKKRRKTARK